MQLAQRRPQHVGGDGELAEAATRLRQRAGEQAQRALHVLVLLGEHREHGVRGVDQLRQLLVLAAERFDQQAEVVDRARDVRVADFQLLGEALGLARERVEALERGREGLPVFLEAFARAREQLLQVGACFGVEPGEELVEVDVRRGLGEGDRFAAAQPPGRGRAGVDLDRHVLQPRLGAHQERRVTVEAGVLGGHFHRHRGDPVLQVHARDFADLGAGDRDRLALARRQGLGGLELRLQRVVAAPQHRHPARQLEVLVRQDVSPRGGGDHDHRDDRDERRAVALDLFTDAETAFAGGRGVHHPPSAGPEDCGPLKLGSVCV